MRCTLPVLLLLLPPVLPPVILPALMVPGTLPRLLLPSLCGSSVLQPLEPALHSHSAPLAMHALPCLISCMLTAFLQRPAMLRWQHPAQHKGIMLVPTHVSLCQQKHRALLPFHAQVGGTIRLFAARVALSITCHRWRTPGHALCAVDLTCGASAHKRQPNP